MLVAETMDGTSKAPRRSWDLTRELYAFFGVDNYLSFSRLYNAISSDWGPVALGFDIIVPSNKVCLA